MGSDRGRAGAAPAGGARGDVGHSSTAHSRTTVSSQYTISQIIFQIQQPEQGAGDEHDEQTVRILVYV